MKIQHVFIFFVIFWLDQYNAYTVLEGTNLDIVMPKCKNLQDTPLLQLEKHLFCDYDNSIYPYYSTMSTLNVTMLLILKLMDFDKDTLSLGGWISLVWRDHHLTWTPSDYNGITSIHVKGWKVWTPDLWVFNPADVSDHQYELLLKECFLSNTGSISCISPVKLNSKCDPDYTYWPYDKQQCRITFSSWIYLADEVDFQIQDENAVTMNLYQSNTEWNFKFINATKEYKTDECCRDEIFSFIEYNFLLTRNSIIKHAFLVIPALILILLTITVLCLDLKSIERTTLASVNFICHLLCLYDLHWRLPINGVNSPNIMLFYCSSLALATFAMILTVLLRKLEDTDTNMPNWISFMTTFILNNRTGHFLILKNDEFKASSDVETEGSSNVLKSEVRLKKSSWKHFATIVDWFSSFCVILTYVIIFITLVPSG